MQDISGEIRFKTARSGGKGGQHVNKVESQAEGFWKIEESSLFTAEEIKRLLVKLANRINEKGELHVKSAASRSQLSNKKTVIRKINELVSRALVKKKPRIATSPTAASRENRIKSKKLRSEIKQSRGKFEQP